MKRRFHCVLCMMALALTLCTGAMASGPSDLSIAFNGEPLTFTDAAPQIVNDRTYLPFRAVFTALGFADENITYANDTRTVSAVREDLEVSMVIGENKVTIVREGETTVLDTDVPAFIDPAVSRTFVPVSFVAQAVGYRVAWNGESRTVFIDDVEGILAANAETYEIMDKYLDYSRKFQKKNYKVEGGFAYSVNVLGEGMEMGGTYSMLTAGNARFDAEMQMNLSGLVDGADMSAAIPEGVELFLRGDMSTGEFYFKSDTLMTMMETDIQNLWFKMDREEMMASAAAETAMSSTDLLSMSRDMDPEAGGRELVERMVRSMAQTDPTMSAADYLAVYNLMMGDSAFTKDGGDYVSTFEMDGMVTSMIFHTAGGKVNGYTVCTAAEEEGVGMVMEVSMKNDKMSVFYEIVDESMSMVMELDGAYTATREEPVGVPDGEAAVLDLKGMTGS